MDSLGISKMYGNHVQERKKGKEEEIVVVGAS